MRAVYNMTTFGMSMVSGGGSGPLCASWFCRAIKKHNLFNISCSGVNKQSPHRRRINNAITAQPLLNKHTFAHRWEWPWFTARAIPRSKWDSRRSRTIFIYLLASLPQQSSARRSRLSSSVYGGGGRRAHMNMLNYFTADGELWPPLAQNPML